MVEASLPPHRWPCVPAVQDARLYNRTKENLLKLVGSFNISIALNAAEAYAVGQKLNDSHTSQTVSDQRIVREFSNKLDKMFRVSSKVEEMLDEEEIETK